MFGNSSFLTPERPRKFSSSAEPKLSKAKLKEELKKRGLSHTGNKKQLEERLSKYSRIHGVSSPLGLSGRYEDDQDQDQVWGEHSSQ